MVVWIAEWPIQACTAGTSARRTASVPNRVAQVVEAQLSESRAREGALVAVAERRASMYFPEVAREDEVLVAGEQFAAGELRERGRDIGDHRHRANLPALRRALAAVRVVAPANADRPTREVDVRPTAWPAARPSAGP